MGKVIMSGIVPQLEVPCPYDPVFANNTWTEIIKACQTNNIPAEWNVGDQKTMTIGGTAYAIDIIGMNHDDYADGSGKAPLTFQMHDCLTTKYRMNSSRSTVGGWKQCDMRQSYLGWDILITLPKEVQTALREVNKLSSEGEVSSTIITTADKLFLLSEVEVLGYCQYSAVGQGTQYEYYAAGNSKQKDVAGNNSWWNRSPDITSNGSFTVIYNGSHGSSAANSVDYGGVAFAFCF